MKNFFILVICGCVLSTNIFASVPITGKVVELWVNDNSAVNIGYVSVGLTYVTPCTTNPAQYLVIDFSEPGMREAYSMALAAFMAGKKITMAGSGVCKGGTEKLKYINLIATNQ